MTGCEMYNLYDFVVIINCVFCFCINTGFSILAEVMSLTMSSFSITIKPRFIIFALIFIMGVHVNQACVA